MLLSNQTSRPVKVDSTVLRKCSRSTIKTNGRGSVSGQRSAEAFPAHFKKLTGEERYKPEQVFKADKSRLHWKKVPSLKYTSKNEKCAPVFRAAKDRLTLIYCGNATGHMIKPDLLYRSANPPALKGKNKILLPVYWQ
jgi:hypothetical protein